MAKTKEIRRAREHRRPTLAERADRYDLYQQSVQEPSFDVEFFERVYKQNCSGEPLVLREDFCGTAAISCEWVKSSRLRRAVAIDLDPAPLEWCRTHNFPRLGRDERDRVDLLQQDVLDAHDVDADIISVQNFSFFYYQSRESLLRYLRTARSNLKPSGVIVMDMVGGTEVQEEDREEITEKDGFDYVWEQHSFDPITSEQVCYIHFHFPDGSRLKRAFEYRWRLWTIPELRELLLEAGFRRADIYWEGTDEDGDGDGEYERVEHASNEPAWIAYVVGVK
ncbi:MAG: class I SAM-dependent methyltransferase [Acidobacteriota bacterium]|nr:class I SAM-dependent methyltransferase [Acidobacteriota bacterium]